MGIPVQPPAPAPAGPLRIAPKSVSLHAGQTQAFAVSGGAGPVTWSVEPQAGNIGSNGVYAAPKAVLRGTNVTVTANDGASFDTAAIELTSLSIWVPFVGVYYLVWAAALLLFLIPGWDSICPNCRPAELRLNPPVVTVTASQPVRFTATAPVTWGDNVSSGGLFKAPDAAPPSPSINVTATSAADTKRTATASVIWSSDIGVMLQPQDATVTAGGTLEITPVFTVAADKQARIDLSSIAVDWMQPALGRIAARPDKVATFTAPRQLDRAATIMLMANAHSPGFPARAAGTYITLLPAAKSWACREDGSAGTGTLVALIFLAGALGGLIHGCSSFAVYVGNREYKTSWTWWYIVRPVLGGIVALVVYLVIRAGFGAGDLGLTAADCLKTAGFAGLIGMFAEPATVKLRDIFEAIFTPRQDPRKDAAAPKEPKPAKPGPKILGIRPDTVQHGTTPVLEVTGSDFASGCVVKVAGAARKPRSVSPARLEVQLEATDIASAGAVTVVVCNTPPDSDNSNSVTLKVS